MRRNLIRWIWGMAVLAAMSFSCTKPVVIVPPEAEDEQRIWEVEVRELDSSCDGQKIFGQLHFPKGRKGKVPLLICSHGLSGTYKECLAYADSAATHGYAAYVFDFRGGGSKASKSEGDVLNMSIFTEADDLEAVWATLKRESFYDASRVFLCGGSQGGLVSALVGARHPSEVRGMVLLFPAFNIPDYARLLYKDYDSVPEKVNLFGFTFGKKYADGLLEYDPYKDMRSYRNPVLILHGTADLLVPVSYSEKAASTYPDATLEKMKGQPHGFDREGVAYAAGRALEFLRAVK